MNNNPFFDKTERNIPNPHFQIIKICLFPHFPGFTCFHTFQKTAYFTIVRFCTFSPFFSDFTIFRKTLLFHISPFLPFPGKYPNFPISPETVKLSLFPNNDKIGTFQKLAIFGDRWKKGEIGRSAQNTQKCPNTQKWPNLGFWGKRSKLEILDDHEKLTLDVICRRNFGIKTWECLYIFLYVSILPVDFSPFHKSFNFSLFHNQFLRKREESGIEWENRSVDVKDFYQITQFHLHSSPYLIPIHLPISYLLIILFHIHFYTYWSSPCCLPISSYFICCLNIVLLV